MLESHGAFQPSQQQFWKVSIRTMPFACSPSNEIRVKTNVLRDLKAGKTFSHPGISSLFGPLYFSEAACPWVKDSHSWSRTVVSGGPSPHPIPLPAPWAGRQGWTALQPRELLLRECPLRAKWGFVQLSAKLCFLLVRITLPPRCVKVQCWNTEAHKSNKRATTNCPLSPLYRAQLSWARGEQPA